MRVIFFTLLNFGVKALLKRSNLYNLIFLFLHVVNLNASDNFFQNYLLNLGITDNTSFYLEKLTFEADVFFSQEEFLYLTDLKEGSFVTAQDVEKACKQLKYKKRINNVDVEIESTELGKRLHFKLSTNWLFKKMVLKGIWFDKHQYTGLYLLQAGDVFDISLHEESIKAIKTYLYNQGFFDAVVQDELIYKKLEKSIVAKVWIKTKRCFSIDKVVFELSGGGVNDCSIGEEELYIFKDQLRRKIGDDILNKDYSRDLITKEVDRIKKIFYKKGFRSCHVCVKKIINKTDNIVEVSFNIKLGKRRFLSFDGNVLFSDKQIREELLGLDYPDWLFSPDIIAEQILHEYYQKGYWKTVIHHKQIEGGGYLFMIDEGDVIEIKSVQIKDLQTKEKKEVAHFFSELLKRKAFNDSLLLEGEKDLKQFYLRNGYWDFDIEDKEFIKHKKSKNCTIILEVQTGKQRFWDGFAIDNFRDLGQDEFFEKYSKQKKDQLIPFNFYWLQEQKLFLLQHFQTQGYWYVDVFPEIHQERVFDKKLEKEIIKAFVKWKIILGPKIKFGKVVVHGSTRLPFNRVIKELRFKQGELWDREKLDLTRKRLKKLDVFKHVQIQPYKLSNDKSEQNQPVILTLIDDDPVQTHLRAGYFLTSKNFLFKRASTFKIGTSLIIKNPTNQADKLTFNADFNRFERKLDIDYQVPSPFNLNINNFALIGKFKGYANKYVHPVQIGSSGSAYEAIQNGLLIGLSNEFKPHHFWGINIGNEWMNTSRVRGDLKFDDNMVNKTLPYLFIEPNLIIDKLDDRLDTKKGSLSFFALKFMIPEISGDSISKIMLEQSFFHPLHGSMIGAIRIRFGHIFRQQFETIQPIERFYLGGPYSVRGYEKDAVPPLGAKEIEYKDSTVEKQYTIQGGSSMINVNLELRFPIYKSFGAVVFQDIGVLSQSGFSGFKGRWYPSTGFGFRYKTPVGALRFDIGWKWKTRLPGDTAYAWYLTLGQAF